MPEVRPGEIAALAAALRWCAAAVGHDKTVQDQQEAQLKKSIGSVAAHLLMASVAGKAEMVPMASLPALKVAKIPADELLGGVARARALGEWAGLHIALPRKWIDPLIASLKRPDCPLDAGQLLVLGEAALDGYSMELGYVVSTAGLAKGEANAEFLFLRSLSAIHGIIQARGLFDGIAGTSQAGAQHRTGWKNSGSSEREKRWQAQALEAWIRNGRRPRDCQSDFNKSGDASGIPAGWHGQR